MELNDEAINKLDKAVETGDLKYQTPITYDLVFDRMQMGYSLDEAIKLTGLTGVYCMISGRVDAYELRDLCRLLRVSPLKMLEI